MLPLMVSANYFTVAHNVPSNDLELTQMLVDATTNTSFFGGLFSGTATKTVNHTLFGKLCFPTSSTKNVSTVQFLTHGATLDHNYWDIMPGYSYVDAAATAGYATFSYDRLGSGFSDHPAAWDVQGPVQVELAHAIIEMLRNQTLGDYAFSKVVGVGHSAGCSLTTGITSKYSSDFDAVILTGISAVTEADYSSLVSWNPVMANQDSSGRFAAVPDGYFTQSTKQALHYAFYKYPFFEPASKWHCFQTKIYI